MYPVGGVEDAKGVRLEEGVKIRGRWRKVGRIRRHGGNEGGEDCVRLLYVVMRN